MALTNAEVEQLEAYYLNELSSKEEEAIERRMNSDPAYRHAALAWQTLWDAFAPTEAEEADRHADIRARLDALPLPRPQANPIRRYLWALGLAAAAALALLLYIIPDRPAKILYAGHYKPTLDVRTKLSQPKNADRLAADNAYLEEQWLTAMQRYQQYLKKTNDETRLIYGAIAAIYAGHARKALPTLEELHRTPRPTVPENAVRWYLALAYAETNKPDQAQALLTDLLDDPIYGAWAQDLTNRLSGI